APAEPELRNCQGGPDDVPICPAPRHAHLAVRRAGAARCGDESEDAEAGLGARTLPSCHEWHKSHCGKDLG
ncbi:unnamed protein product, partial [Symbiodinium sp. KB8]